MRNTIAVFLLIFLFIMLLCGCSLSVQQIDSLMRPPMAQGDYHGLQEVFYETVGKDIVLKTPQSGQYRSSFVMLDIDNDLVEEALAFYVKQNDKSTVRVHILHKEADKWYSIGDFSGAGGDVDSIKFAYMNGDQIPELLISWLTNGNKNKRTLTVYKCLPKTGKLEISAIHTELYTLMEPLDLDNDGENEIFIVYLDNTAEVPQAYAKVFKMIESGEIVLLSQAKLDGNIVSYGKIKTEEASEGYPMRIFIDANKGESQMITEMIYWDAEKNTLTAPLLNPQTQSNILTLRNSRIPTADINNDGIIEIPTQVTMPGAKNLQIENDKTELIYLTKWIQVRNDGNAVEAVKSVMNFSGRYMLTVPKDLDDKITIINYNKDRRWDICAYQSLENIVGDVLFSIISIEKQVWDSNAADYDGYFPVIYDSKYVIAVRLSNAGTTYGFTNEFIKQNIIAYNAE